jgi:para-aminobenzoate synthetase component 1
MTIFRPEVSGDKAISLTRCSRAWEHSRLEWSVTDSGNPGHVLSDFLDSHGLGLPIGAAEGRPTTESHDSKPICGATLYLSAAAGAAMLGVSAGRPSPAPGVPDVVAVVYGHGAPGAGRDRAEGRPRPDVGWHVGAWQASWSPQEHAGAVDAVRQAIARGDVYQVNVVGHASAPYLGDPLPALRRVTALPGARYGSVLSGSGWAIACASPEMLVRVQGGTVETRPIKGTRAATASGRRELLSSAKERAEHVMIVDLERNDLAHVAVVGTVDVPELFAVRRWCDLWQAESRVAAALADGVDLATLLRAVFPGGSVTGAPKLAALAEIAELEPVGRGPSMGALGWLDAEQLDLGLTIRTAAADRERLHLWAGGGITWDSDPYAEVAEAADKAAPLRAALAEGGPQRRPQGAKGTQGSHQS